MLGSIIGDVLGSVYEGSGIKDPNLDLFRLCGVTDDTLCCLAISDWLMEGALGHPGSSLKKWCRPYLDRGFGGMMRVWLKNDSQEENSSWGNGSVMRAAPIAFWAQSDPEAMDLATRSVRPTHSHPESVLMAQATVWAIRSAFAHQNPQKLLQDAAKKWSFEGLESWTIEDARAHHKFDVSARGTVPLAILCAAKGGSFEGAIRAAISMGGDADTLACVTGSIAEGLYGIDPILANHALRQMDWQQDQRWQKQIVAFLSHDRVQQFYANHNRPVPDPQFYWDQGPLPGTVNPRQR